MLINDRDGLFRFRAGACLPAMLLALLSAGTQEPPAGEGRPLWTTSRIRGSPEPPPPYRLERVFPKLTFDHPLEIVRTPTMDRLFVIEHHQEHLGRIFSFPDDPGCDRADLFLDLPAEVHGWESLADCKGVGAAYSMAFHPDFDRNPYCYVCYVLESKAKGKSLPRGSRVSRFTVTRTNPPRADPTSEVVLLEWPEGGHNGGCLRFGPDGYLYVSTGDGAAPNPPDGLKAGQDLSRLLSKILRIDVDRSEGGKPYAIPSDNPFLATPGARPETWAYGLRNPWRMNFDPERCLWVGDVGWERWEMLYAIRRGGNYGWSITEGPNPVNPEGIRGPTPILPPAMSIEHPEAASITAGYVYRGTRLPELRGAYVFADFEMFRVFSAKMDGDRLFERRELARTQERIVSFAEGRDREILLLDYLAGGIHRLVPNDRSGPNPDFPQNLSQTGLFQSVVEGTPSPGVVPFSVNAEQWLDHATGERWVALPDASAIESQGGRPACRKDAVLAKTLSMETVRGKPESRRRIETQILHFDGKDWQGYTYAWDEAQQDAALVPVGGAERTLSILDDRAPGGRREQRWTFPARAACAGCHTVSWARYLASFNEAQLDRDAQLARLRSLRILPEGKVAGGPDETTRLVDPQDVSEPLEARARSYLHVNCGICHRPGGGTSSMLDLRLDRPLRETFAYGVRPALGTFGIVDPYIIAGGDASRSVLFFRMSKLGHGRMPHVGSTLVDEAGLALVARWIDRLPPTGEDAATAGARHEERELLSRIGGEVEALSRLLGSTSGALDLMRSIDERRLPEPVRRAAIRQGIAHQDDAVRGLFERFVRPEERPRRLGTRIDPAEILALQGDSERGRRLFFEGSVLQCRTCHTIEGRGESFGPDLSHIAAKYGRAKILESILEPSKEIDPKYVGYVVRTDQGAVYSGLLLERTAERVVIKDAQKKEIRLGTSSVQQLVAQKTSIMPEFLLQGLTVREASDLLDFLASLR